MNSSTQKLLNIMKKGNIRRHNNYSSRFNLFIREPIRQRKLLSIPPIVITNKKTTFLAVIISNHFLPIFRPASMLKRRFT